MAVVGRHRDGNLGGQRIEQFADESVAERHLTLEVFVPHPVDVRYDVQRVVVRVHEAVSLGDQTPAVFDQRRRRRPAAVIHAAQLDGAELRVAKLGPVDDRNRLAVERIARLKGDGVGRLASSVQLPAQHVEHARSDVDAVTDHAVLGRRQARRDRRQCRRRRRRDDGGDRPPLESREVRKCARRDLAPSEPVEDEHHHCAGSARRLGNPVGATAERANQTGHVALRIVGPDEVHRFGIVGERP